MADHTGQQLGNYRLVRLLGRGGFADVYLGQHVRLQSQQAAIKILATRIDPAEEHVFEREANTIAALTHPHIVRLLDYDVIDGMPFLVMEYAPNGSLRQRHHGGQIVPLPMVVSYVQQIAGALDFAHYKHLIHRDIKPDNMLLDKCDQLLLSDFGVATIAHNTTSQSAQAVIGTVAYMAPEQFQEHPRPASDQYALAITVYEWLSGTRPFTGTFTEVAVKHALVPPPPLLARNPLLPPAVEQIVNTALAKDPKARYPDVRTFANALESASQESPREVWSLTTLPLSLSNENATVAEELAATIPPSDGVGNMAMGTVILPSSQLVQPTMLVPTSSDAFTSAEGKRAEPGAAPEAITSAPVQIEQKDPTTSAPVSASGSGKASSRGKNSLRPLTCFVKRLAHKAM
ncbi:MAG TPA: serine/threonine-protein kinase [Ktedonobacteraceae bacterium]